MPEGRHHPQNRKTNLSKSLYDIKNQKQAEKKQVFSAGRKNRTKREIKIKRKKKQDENVNKKNKIPRGGKTRKTM